MKTGIFRLMLTGVMVTATLALFGQESKKAAKARKDMVEAKQDLKEAKIDSANDYKQFRKDAEMRISDNQKKIDALKAKNKTDNKVSRDKYDAKLLGLQQKNDDLKMQLNGSDKTTTSKWTSFKREFHHDMDELGRAIKDVTVNNTK